MRWILVLAALLVTVPAFGQSEPFPRVPFKVCDLRDVDCVQSPQADENCIKWVDADQEWRPGVCGGAPGGGITGILADTGGTTTGTTVSILGESASQLQTVRSGDTVTVEIDATPSRCARFDGAGNLVPATGDCTAGDTGGSPGLSTMAEVSTCLANPVATPGGGRHAYCRLQPNLALQITTEFDWPVAAGTGRLVRTLDCAGNKIDFTSATNGMDAMRINASLNGSDGASIIRNCHFVKTGAGTGQAAIELDASSDTKSGEVYLLDNTFEKFDKTGDMAVRRGTASGGEGYLVVLNGNRFVEVSTGIQWRQQAGPDSSHTLIMRDNDWYGGPNPGVRSGYVVDFESKTGAVHSHDNRIWRAGGWRMIGGTLYVNDDVLMEVGTAPGANDGIYRLGDATRVGNLVGTINFVRPDLSAVVLAEVARASTIDVRLKHGVQPNGKCDTGIWSPSGTLLKHDDSIALGNLALGAAEITILPVNDKNLAADDCRVKGRYVSWTLIARGMNVANESRRIRIRDGSRHVEIAGATAGIGGPPPVPIDFPRLSVSNAYEKVDCKRLPAATVGTVPFLDPFVFPRRAAKIGCVATASGATVRWKHPDGRVPTVSRSCALATTGFNAGNNGNTLLAGTLTPTPIVPGSVRCTAGTQILYDTFLGRWWGSVTLTDESPISNEALACGSDANCDNGVIDNVPVLAGTVQATAGGGTFTASDNGAGKWTGDRLKDPINYYGTGGVPGGSYPTEFNLNVNCSPRGICDLACEAGEGIVHGGFPLGDDNRDCTAENAPVVPGSVYCEYALWPGPGVNSFVDDGAGNLVGSGLDLGSARTINYTTGKMVTAFTDYDDLAANPGPYCDYQAQDPPNSINYSSGAVVITWDAAPGTDTFVSYTAQSPNSLNYATGAFNVQADGALASDLTCSFAGGGQPYGQPGTYSDAVPGFRAWEAIDLDVTAAPGAPDINVCIGTTSK